MQTFKPNAGELPELRKAAELLKKSNEALAKAKKAVEAAKASIGDWLLKERQCDVKTLAVMEHVNIEGVALIEVAKMNKFDEKAFQLAHPAMHEEFKKDFTKILWKPLV